VRLGLQFDCVFVHDAVVYMLTERDLRQAIETAFVHCRPGAVAVYDRHVEGLFSRREWLQWLRDAGFEPAVVPFEHSELEPGSHEVFLCRRST
jgi:hypothetical protein